MGQDTRRTAERAALAVLGGRVKAVGELGLAAAWRETAAGGPDRAAVEAADLVTAARAEGRRLVQAARAEVGDAGTAYATAYAAALDAGWTPADLTGLGYPAPPRRRPASTPPGAPLPAGRTPDNGTRTVAESINGSA